MSRVLFVDDSEDVLAGLRNRLRGQRGRWDMVFVQSGDEALAELARAPFDVVVSDMRMPGMDGAELLSAVELRHPDIARIVLSGDADRDAVARVLPVVHQFLEKPCDGNVLKAAIERACALRATLWNEGLRDFLRRLGPLPTLPPTYHALAWLARDGRSAGTAAAATLVRGDALVCAPVTQLAAGAGLGSLDGLTAELLQALTLAASLFALAGEPPSLIRLPDQALRVARLALRLLGASRAAPTAFAAALLRDVGRIVLTRALGVRAELSDDAQAALDAPQTMAAISAALLGEWKIAPAVVETVACADRPAAQRGAAIEPWGAVRAAESFLAASSQADVDRLLDDLAGNERSRWSDLVNEARRSTT